MSGAGASARTGHPLVFALFGLLMVFNVALPKGGIAYDKVPLTYGYALVGLLAPVALVGLMRRPGVAPAAVLHFLAFFVPQGLFTLYRVLTGDSPPVVILTWSTLFLTFPFVMLILFSSYLEALTERQIGLLVKWCVGFVIVWGLFNFFSYALFRHFTEIPYVTVNSGDVGEIMGKNNRRGGLMKLVSTYNNGNVCGACLIMLMPLYFYFTKSRVWLGLLCLTVVLTLSRTAWFGLAVTFTVMLSMRLTRLNNIFVWITGCAVVGLLVVIMPIIGWTPDRLFDVTLGNRQQYWSELEITAFGSGPVRTHEILYAGLLGSFGFVGSLLAIGALVYPVVYGTASFTMLSDLRRSALAGIIAYLVIAASDAAFIYPPVFLQWLFLALIVYRRGFRGAREDQTGGNVGAWQPSAGRP